jgi:parvulin-like peptidyl-prolyl isomerase
MIAKERGRRVAGAFAALSLIGSFGVQSSFAQGRRPVPTPAQPPAQGQAAAPGNALPQLKLTALPVNPTDPIAIINNQVITRQQLSDECVSRKGEEILETMTARLLIEQALRAHKMEITSAEVDQEIDNVAMRVAGLGREAWLRTLDKERGISPVQYAQDIIYPALALRKLAASKVVVTPQDESDSFEAQYGEKLRVRMIMVDKLQTAKSIWEELRKNPSGFEKMAMEQSMDTGSRSLGGLLAEPISRHAYPKNVSEAAFYQLVDGDAADKNPAHKPKDGDFTGPIQVAEATWVLLRRESMIPAQPMDRNNPAVKKSVYEMIYEVKLKEKMAEYMSDLLQNAAIDNKLTGRIKLANERYDTDEQVKLMGGRPTPSAAQAPSAGASTPAANAPKGKAPLPAALSPDVARQAEAIKKSQTQPK